ncbi:MAG: transporter substrate-binding domain-containing protein [Candidatus Cloacimonetes bacterium]|nr:transporter substrate-binding domain-containing protein [Candidatus Cloacimonadota bacterium]
MRNYLGVMTIVFLLFLYASSSAAAGSNLPERIKVGYYENQPLIYTDKETKTVKGIYADLLNAIADKENWQLEYAPLDWNECLERLQNGSIDIMPAIGFSEQRSKHYLFSRENVLVNWGQVFTPRNSQIESITDLHDKKIGVMKNDIYYSDSEGILSLTEEFGVTCVFIEYATYEDIFRALMSNALDAGITDRLNGNQLYKRYFNVRKTSIIFKPVDLRFAFPKNSLLSLQLIPMIDSDLLEMKKNRNSTYNQSLNNLLQDLPVYYKHYLVYLQVFAITFLVAIVAILLWNWSLNKNIKLRTGELRESEKKYRSLYSLLRLMTDNVPDMIWAKDLEKRYTFANKTICEQLLIAENTDEPIGKNDLFFAARQRKRYPQNKHWHTFGEICANSDEIVMKEKKARRFDEYGNVLGKFLFLDVHKAPFWNEEGEMIGTVGSARDVTNEKRLERERTDAMEKLRLREEFNFALFNYNPIETIVVDKEGKIIKTNKALHEKRQRLPDIGTLMFKDYAANYDHNMHAELQNCLKSGRIKSFPDLIYAQDRHFSVTISPFPQGAIITAEDISDRKHAEEQIEKLTSVFENLKTDPEENIYFIVQQTQQILHGTCSLFNKLDNKEHSLYVWAISDRPDDLTERDIPEGHICYEATIKGKNKTIIIPDLDKTRYVETDPNVRKYKLKSYLGHPVHLQGKPVGSLCIVDSKPRNFSEIEVKIITTLAKAVSIEEERKMVAAKIRDSLEEKEILLKEIHHRVKNNMQIISSLLKLQARKITDKYSQELFQDSYQRVKSMALIHEKLYASSDLMKIDFSSYISNLTENILKNFSMGIHKIKMHTDIKDLFLDINTAIPCGLIINELVMNSVKYAFTGRKEGNINISMQKGNNNIISLVVKDDGLGIPAGVNLKEPETLGLQLIQALSSQLRGNFSITGKNGTAFTLKFSEKKDKKEKSAEI